MLEEFFLLLPFLMERAKAGRLKCAANARVAEADGSWPQNGSGDTFAVVPRRSLLGLLPF
jgi:hypothetical protein